MAVTISGTTGVQGNLQGDVTGNVTGNITGNVTGNLTGTASNASGIQDGIVSAADLNGNQTGDAPIYGCRAWANFDATRNVSGGTDALLTARFIRSQGNIGSVTKTDTGKYDVLFITPMLGNDYSVVGTSVNGIRSGARDVAVVSIQSTTTTGFTLETLWTGGGGSAQFNDFNIISFAVFD